MRIEKKERGYDIRIQAGDKVVYENIIITTTTTIAGRTLSLFCSHYNILVLCSAFIIEISKAKHRRW